LRGKNKPILTPVTARNILRTTGSPQQDAPGRPATQRIGNRPNLKQAFDRLGIGKSLIKDTVKDHKEIVKEKDFKENKDSQKDIKEKEVKEFVKDQKEKDLKDFKEGGKDVKDLKEKDHKEVKDVHEGGGKIRDVINPPPASTGGVEERINQLEQTVAQLTHFISQSLRPDLQTSALNQEDDAAMLSQQLEKEATDAKAAKDQKDIEKVREV
jgi:hypothetical protein